MVDRLVVADDDDDVQPARAVSSPRQEFGPGVLFQLGNEQAKTEEEVIALAVRYLAGVCDGATRRDNVGYNRLHARMGHALAEKPVAYWSPREAWAARKMLETYKNRQLAFIWPYMPPLEPEPPVPADVADQERRYTEWRRKTDPSYLPDRRYRELSLIKRDGAHVAKLSQNYDPELVELIKKLPQRRYEGGVHVGDEKYWYVPLQLDALEPLINFAVEHGYTIADDVGDAIDQILGVYQDTMELSRAASTDFEIDLPPGLSLFPFQKAGVQYCLKVGNALVADEMGLGKTVEALATVKITNGFPVIVICPASLKRNWERETKKWLPDARVGVLSGHPFPLRNLKQERIFDVVIINYNSRVLERWLMKLVEFGALTIILDEAHNVKNESAQQTKLVESLLQHSTRARRMLLTGTPVVNRPKEFWTMIKMLGRAKEMGGYTEFMKRYDTTDLDRLEELNVRSRTHFMIRRLKKDVLPELPPKLRTIVPIEIDNLTQYERAEYDIAGYFATIKANDDAFLREIERYADAKALEGDHRALFLLEAKREHFNAAYMIAAQNERLLRWEALKQMAVRGKMKGVVAWIDDFLADSDQKLVVFAEHTLIIEALAEYYRAPFIHGGVNSDKRQPLVDRFQTDPSTRVIVGNMKAMGEGLTMTAASNVAFVEFGWNPKTHDQAEDRCHRIGQHDSVMVWNLAAIKPNGDPTIDFELADMIDRKREMVDAIQDGADAATQRSMMEELQQRLTGRLRSHNAIDPIAVVREQAPSIPAESVPNTYADDDLIDLDLG